MENKRGSEIFLGVVGVATLIVAIIGATFAFFSASLTANENVELESYKYSASLSLSRVDETSNLSLVPLKEANIDNALTATDGICQTKDGFSGCALYKLSFVNNGSGPITLNGTLKTVANAGEGDAKFTNLKYQLLTSTDGENFTTSGSSVAIDGTVDGTTNLPQTSSIANGGGTEDIYLLIYLNDTGVDQPTEMGVTYTGTITYTSGDDAASALTAEFNLG